MDGFVVEYLLIDMQSVVHTVGLERAGQSSSRLQSLVCVHDRLSNLPQSNSSPT